MRGAMGAIATWIFFPSLGLTLIAGLLAIGLNRGFHEAGWAWLKAATGILVFESGFVGVLGPDAGGGRAQRAGARGPARPGDARRIARAGAQHPVGAARRSRRLNVVLGIWRPRLTRRTAKA